MPAKSDIPKAEPNDGRKRLAGIVAVILGILVTILLRRTGAPLIHWQWLLYLLFPLIVLSAIVIWQRRHPSAGQDQGQEEYGHAVAWSLTFSAVFYLFSGSTDDPWFYFLRWAPQGLPESRYSLLASGVVRLCLWTTIIAPVLFFCRSKLSMWAIMLGILVLSQIACFNQLWRATGGEALYSGDHPCSMYRLWAYAHSFPNVIFYDPFWNGGREVSCLATTGTLPLGAIFSPLWRFFQVDQVYTPVLALVFMIVVPLLAAFSVHIVRGGLIAGCCAGIMALGISQDFFRWMLSNGAIGSCFALSFMMPLCACIYRVIWLDGLENLTGISLALAAVMFLSWPPAALMAAVLIPAVLLSKEECSLRKITLLMLCGVVAVVLWIPVVAGVLGHRNPFAFFGSTSDEIALPGILHQGWAHLSGLVRTGNPCIIFFGLLGLWFLPQKGMKRFFGTVVICLCILAGWGAEWKPLLQLSRAGIPLFFAAIIPAALWMEKCLQDASVRMSIVRPVILVMLLLGGLNTSSVYANKGQASYSTMSHDIPQLVEWVGKNTHENERILFAGGNMADECGMGKAACLPLLTGREIVDADYFHLSLPEAAATDGGDQSNGISGFMDLYNVSYVLTSSEQWRDYLARHPQQYEELKSFAGPEGRTMFRVIRKPDQFVTGSGSIKAGIDELAVRLDNPMEEAVLRYNWEDEMYSEAPVEVRPFAAGRDVRFIAVNPHGKTAFTIHCGKIF